MPTVFCTICVSIGLLATFITLLIGAIRLGKGLYNKTDIKGIEKLATLSFIGFLLPVIAIYAYGYITAKNASTALISISLTQSSVVGIVLSAICMGIVLIIKQVVKGKNVLERSNIVKLICSVIGITFVSIVLALLGKGFITQESSSSAIEVVYAISSLLSLVSPTYAKQNTSSADAKTMYVSSTISYFVFIFMVVASLLLLYYAILSLLTDKNQGSTKIAFSVVIMALSILYLIMSLVTASSYANLLASSASSIVIITCKASGAVIASLVLSVVLLVTTIIETILLHKDENLKPSEQNCSAQNT